MLKYIAFQLLDSSYIIYAKFSKLVWIINPHHLPRRGLNKIDILAVTCEDVCFCTMQEIVDIRAFRAHGATTAEVNDPMR